MKLYNTLSRRKEDFETIETGVVKMYSCGPTVYDLIHIGNARPMVVFDSLRRYLEYKGYKVIHVQNYTDVDDKIIKKALREGVSSSHVSERFIAESKKDEEGLSIRKHSFKPKVTEEMKSIVSMISDLVENGMAYEHEGTVYYDTTRFPSYGALSGKNIEELEAGARVEADGSKRSVSDFVLWKPAKEGEPLWESPWGDGRPGWHIECSAMIRTYLGDTIDIHTGGEDLIFPHHENEIAQSQGLTGKPLARYWLHNSFLNVDNHKMAKSRGNFFTVRDISKKYPYEVMRFLLISAHYRMPINFSEELMQASQNGLRRIKNCASKLDFHIKNSSRQACDTSILEQAAVFRTSFEEALDNDFNTADGVTAIFELVRLVNSHIDTLDTDTSKKLYQTLTELCYILGIHLQDTDETQGDTQEIEALIKERQALKAAKDFVAADAIRQKLADMGIEIKDTRDGTQWTRI